MGLRLDSAFWVPALLVTHYIVFVLLMKDWRASHIIAGRPVSTP
jgi:hypothetical protein